MNVILIISDTLRRDHLGCYGNPWIRTPHLDRFAERCVIFDRAMVSSFPTVPCRNDVMTGRFTFTYKPWAPLGAEEVTLAETLQRAGTVTGLVVDTPHPFTPGFNYQRGFQAWEVIRGQEGDRWKSAPREMPLPCQPHKLRGANNTVVQYLRNVAGRRLEQDYFAPRTMRAAAEWLEENHGSPFFLYVDTFDPHEPWDPPRHYVEMYDPGYEGEEVIYPSYDRCDYLSEAELKHCRALYAGEVTMVDRWVGMLLDRAESLGLLENTAILFLADHGFYLGEHGYIGKSLITPQYQQAVPLYPEVCAIPFLAHLPGMTASRRSAALVQPADLMPTVLELAGAEVPATVQGRSLKALIEGGAERVRDIAVASPTISHANLQVPHPTTRSTISDGEWLFVYGSQVDHIDEPEVTQMVDNMRRNIRTLEEGPVRPELYHIPSDAGCVRNVLEANRSTAQALHGEYVRFLEGAGVPERHLRFFREFRAGD
jgi:arylsulfatase A-like enzyme